LAGIYIHIPFCSGFCIYCDFYSTKYASRKVENFVDALLREVSSKRDFFPSGQEITTVYIGGGTPSLLTPGQLFRVTEALMDTFGMNNSLKIKEFTLEVNPDDVNAEYLRDIKVLGVNRLSMGVQSFCDDELKWMNRRHTSAQAIDAFFSARKAGFDNISLDLIFGISNNLNNWRKNLEIISGLMPEHISAYQLGIEKGTKLGRMKENGLYSPADDDLSSEQYSILQELLKKAGYNQYEISNFAFENRESLHNSSYWDHTPYLGLGPSAHSYTDGVRSWNFRTLSGYVEGQMKGKIYFAQEKLSEKEFLNEKIMLSLRRVKGANLKDIEQSCSPENYYKFEKQMKQAVGQGRLLLEGDTIKIPPDKLFLSDGIIRDLII